MTDVISLQVSIVRLALENALKPGFHSVAIVMNMIAAGVIKYFIVLADNRDRFEYGNEDYYVWTISHR